MEGMEDILREFLVETYENLDQLDQDLLTLESSPDDGELHARIFRTMHTVKGTSGFLGLDTLESVTHVAENLMSAVRDGKLAYGQDHASVLLETGDALRRILGNLESTGAEGDDKFEGLVGRLEAALRGEAPPAAETAAADVGAATGRAATEPVDEEALMAASWLDDGDDDDDGESVAAAPAAKPTAPAAKPAAPAAKPAAPAATKPGGGGEPRSSGPSVSETSIRVNVDTLDALMNLVGELVLTRNQIMQFASGGQLAGEVSAAANRLNLITSELQTGIMQTRMQQVGRIWSKVPRIVRDLSMTCGKEVQVEMSGQETELDRTLVEAIKDPLTHVVRNAVDHGIEDPDAREACGKPRMGTLRLNAYHDNGLVNLEVSDDGRGIDPDKVKARALEKGVIDPATAARMSEADALNLIFAPGFSTAAAVTNVSGRGVGMDVVKTNIEGIGGSVDLQSEVGVGTTLKIRIPLTLAIIPALVVNSAGHRFAIPQVSLVELVRLERDQQDAIEWIQGAPVFRLRGRLLPLVYLDRVLSTRREEDAPASLNLVVVQAGDEPFGLVVDEVVDTEEIVVKPLGRTLKDLGAFAGTTIMGDGRVALIVDVPGLAQLGNVAATTREQRLRDAEAAAAAAAAQAESAARTMLVCGYPDGGRAAIDLGRVERLEELALDRIEHVGEQSVVQYRGRILPLVDVGAALPERRKNFRMVHEEGHTPAPDEAQVVVCARDGDQVGLVVHKIHDIVHAVPESPRPGSRAYVTQVAVVDGRVTEFLDVDGLMDIGSPRRAERDRRGVSDSTASSAHAWV